MKIQQNFCGTNKIHRFTQSWNWISIYSKTKLVSLKKNTHNFIAKPDKNWLKSGFYMKLTEIWLLEVPLSKFHLNQPLLNQVFDSSILLAGTPASAGISTKKQDILKLIGTSHAPNGKFTWIELNGEDYGWTREGENVGKYRIVMVEMWKVIVESGRKKLVLVMLIGTQFENELWDSWSFY